MADRLSGIIKWFDNAKGYGFIAPLDTESMTPTDVEIFLHHSAIGGNGFHKVHKGVLVTFSTVPRDKGLAASNVEMVSSQFQD
ncbi:cold shock domain-containing protein [Neiella sp. HB171785]|uniref:Cold shock domain-containing protein n=1 Tax=Neiella litorisoli TaxID=2771431 RepID=A0A8J6UED0_9GAMM|nr:cold shock domain-containing protein [Neiella litorisoli]MBD1389414.1 cold shock domain-containing protein [Neiella litorisoli]